MNAERVITVIANQLAVPREHVTPDKKLVDDLGSDSLDTVEVMMAIEDEFGIEIPDEHWESVVTVQHVLDYVEKRVALL